jgi:inner membrane protein
MASAFTHALWGGSIGLFFAARWPTLRAAPSDQLSRGLIASSDAALRRRLPWIAAALSVMPDADVSMHAFVRYSHPFGHRGAFHSLAFYALVTLLVCLGRPARLRASRVAPCLLLAMTSHSLLDMMTDGGLGIALFWPLSAERWFLPWRPIPVSPLSVSDFFGAWGLRVLRFELPISLSIFALAVWSWRSERREK